MPEISKARPFHEYMAEYKKQMVNGDIREAYKGLMEYIIGLRTFFERKYPDYVVSRLYQGYMEMTYFSIVLQFLKDRKLKVAIVFLHDTCRFEVWLAGQNKQVQTKFWKSFKESGWNKYRIPATTKGADSIIEYILIGNPDFSDLDALTKQLEKGTLEFIKDVESFLTKY